MVVITNLPTSVVTMAVDLTGNIGKLRMLAGVSATTVTDYVSKVVSSGEFDDVPSAMLLSEVNFATKGRATLRFDDIALQGFDSAIPDPGYGTTVTAKAKLSSDSIGLESATTTTAPTTSSSITPPSLPTIAFENGGNYNGGSSGGLSFTGTYYEDHWTFSASYGATLTIDGVAHTFADTTPDNVVTITFKVARRSKLLERAYDMKTGFYLGDDWEEHDTPGEACTDHWTKWKVVP